VAVKVKSAIKKSKVHRVLKIHTSSESDGNSTPQNEIAKNDVVEPDQTVNTEGEATAGPKGDSTVPEVETKEVYFTLVSQFQVFHIIL
jgi:hypothetical protein